MSYNSKNYTKQGGEETVIGGSIDIIASGAIKIGGVALTPNAAQINKLATLASSAAQIDAAVDGTSAMQVIRTSATVAQVEAGTVSVVPAVAGKQFIVTDMLMRSTGSAAGATLIQLIEETANTVYMSHVIADMSDGVWVGKVGGTVVVTGYTAGGRLAAGKKLFIGKTGGALTGTTKVDVIVTGYYTTA